VQVQPLAGAEILETHERSGFSEQIKDLAFARIGGRKGLMTAFGRQHDPVAAPGDHDREAQTRARPKHHERRPGDRTSRDQRLESGVRGLGRGARLSGEIIDQRDALKPEARLQAGG
jgi:hypothetical protein